MRIGASTGSARTGVETSSCRINKGATYSRQELAELWGYASFHAIARGVVTPRDDNKIVLFVTEEKQSSAEQYADRLPGEKLEWEDQTILQKIECPMPPRPVTKCTYFNVSGITDFTYCGRLVIANHVCCTDKPSHFTFKVR